MYLKILHISFTRFTLVASNLRKKISVKAKKKSLESKPIICKIATRRDSRDVSRISKKWDYFHVLSLGCLCVFLHLNLPLMIFHIRNSKRQIIFLICIIPYLLHNPASNESPVKIGIELVIMQILGFEDFLSFVIDFTKMITIWIIICSTCVVEFSISKIQQKQM